MQVEAFTTSVHLLMHLLMSAGGFGIADTIKKIDEGQHMGFDNICAYNPWAKKIKFHV